MKYSTFVFLITLLFSCSSIERGPANAGFSKAPSDRAYYQYSGGSYLSFKTWYRNSQHDHHAIIIYGSGMPFKKENEKKYCHIKTNKNDKRGSIQWVLRDLSANKIIDQSEGVERRFYGASVSKLFVAGAYLDKVEGRPDREGAQELMNLIVQSNNSAWSALQKKAGGMAGVDKFLKDLDITNSAGFRGDLDGVHGNEITTEDLSQFIQDSFDGKFQGSHDLFKTMFLSRTGTNRGKKYLPKSLIVGGKTGTYKGATRLNGRAISSRAVHHTMIFMDQDKYYSMTILSDPGTDLELSSLAGGLYIEYFSDASIQCESVE